MPNFNNTTSFDTSTWNVYTADSKTSDLAQSGNKNEWSFNDFPKYYGIYLSIGQYRQAINAFATWALGQGYECGAREKVLLDHISGWGEDSFWDIIWQMVVIKKVNGDAFAEIITDKEGTLLSEGATLINLKPLDPYKMKIKYSDKGRITKYIYNQGNKEEKEFKPEQILHFCNDRTIDEPHGNSITKAVEWVVEALEEAKALGRRMMRLAYVTIFYVDENDTARQNKLKTELQDGIKSGHIVLMTCKPEEAKLEHTEAPPIVAYISWLNYLEDQFYKALGVPKVVLGGTAENTEASAKVGVIGYEPTWRRECAGIERDILNQLGLQIQINRQPSLMDNMQADEAKNTGQTKLEYQGAQ